MSRLGVNFGFEDSSWDINSGYYEHHEILAAYGNMRKSHRLSKISDNVADFFRQRAIRCVDRALSSVEAVKYPPLSCELPSLVEAAGYKPKLAISARRFESYALSRIRKEGVSWRICKADYINTYQTLLFNLHLFGGYAISYEDITSRDQAKSIQILSEATGETQAKISTVLSRHIREGRNKQSNTLSDKTCDHLYKRLLSLANTTE